MKREAENELELRVGILVFRLLAEVVVSKMYTGNHQYLFRIDFVI